MRKVVMTILAGLVVNGLALSAMAQLRGVSRSAEARSGAERARQAGILDRSQKISALEGEEITPGAGKPQSGSVQVRGVVAAITTETLRLTDASGRRVELDLTSGTLVTGNRVLDVSQLKERQRVRLSGALSPDGTTFTAKVVYLVAPNPIRAGIEQPSGVPGASLKDAVLRKNQAIGELIRDERRTVLVCGEKKVPVVFGPNPRVIEPIRGTPKLLAPGMTVFVIGREIEGRKTASVITLNIAAETKKPDAPLPSNATQPIATGEEKNEKVEKKGAGEKVAPTLVP